MSRLFADRRTAGRELAAMLGRFQDFWPLVLALPRGGVPVGYEVAAALGVPLSVLIVRKIGFPGHEEFGIGALVLAREPELVMNDALVQRLRPDPQRIRLEVQRQLAEGERRRALYGATSLPDLHGRTVIVVDDGIATGGTARAALQALRREQPAWIVLAVPVGSPDSLVELATECDEVVCPHQPADFGAVGAYYDDFTQTSDAEVLQLLREAAPAGSG
ncbi:phosphoribosyltransferase [Sphingomonas sp. GCM10030256]|uniref:phosphoribosyltransferase n=1 Tax=Sphingomonas sp. GCM10030256 TaxID=3273427 RepID=UPI003620FD6A